jgi:hypothetical protein
VSLGRTVASEVLLRDKPKLSDLTGPRAMLLIFAFARKAIK